MAFEHVNSLLVADIGNVHTRLVLIDVVEGQYRLIATSRALTTAAPPLSHVGLGVERAADTMAHQIGRGLLSLEADQMFIMPEAGGHGVDEFLATSSAGRPMRVFLVGLTPEISIASGRRALAGTYVTLTDTLSTDDLRSEEQKINAILRDEPDLILIVGGTDDGADDILLDLVKTVQKSLLLLTRGKMPVVLFAGNRALKRQVDDLLSPVTEVYSARNVRPTLADEQIFPAQIELSLVYDDYRTKSPGGFVEIGRHSQVGVVPTAQGLISAVRYLSYLPQKGVGPLVADIGSANSALVAGIKREPHFTIRTDLGMGHSLASTLEAITPENVRRWLPFEISVDEMWDYAYNKELRPATVPGTAEELMLEQAFAREILRLLVADARDDWGLGQGDLLPAFRPIIAAGSILTEAQHPGIAALLLLDALQPVGVTELQADPYNLLSSLGVVAFLKPIITVQALEAPGLVNLGTAFSPLGRIQYGQDVMYVQARLADGQIVNHTVRGGEIWMVPALPGDPVELAVKLRGGLTISGRRRFKLKVTAGAAGVIFDGRGRPLVLPRPRDRAARFMQWQLAMMGQRGGPPPSPDAGALLPSLEDLYPTPEEAADANLS